MATGIPSASCLCNRCFIGISYRCSCCIDAVAGSLVIVGVWFGCSCMSQQTCLLHACADHQFITSSPIISAVIPVTFGLSTWTTKCTVSWDSRIQQDCLISSRKLCLQRSEGVWVSHTVTSETRFVLSTESKQIGPVLRWAQPSSHGEIQHWNRPISPPSQTKTHHQFTLNLRYSNILSFPRGFTIHLLTCGNLQWPVNCFLLTNKLNSNPPACRRKPEHLTSYRENIQNPHKQYLKSGLNPNPWYWEAVGLLSAPLCCTFKEW